LRRVKSLQRVGIFFGRNPDLAAQKTLKYREDLLAVNPQVQERIALIVWVVR